MTKWNQYAVLLFKICMQGANRGANNYLLDIWKMKWADKLTNLVIFNSHSQAKQTNVLFFKYLQMSAHSPKVFSFLLDIPFFFFQIHILYLAKNNRCHKANAAHIQWLDHMNMQTNRKKQTNKYGTRKPFICQVSCSFHYCSGEVF